MVMIELANAFMWKKGYQVKTTTDSGSEKYACILWWSCFCFECLQRGFGYKKCSALWKEL